MEDSKELEYNITTTADGVRALLSHVEYSISVWPGYPARPAEEQVFLWDLRDTCNRILLEHSLTLSL